MGEKLDGGATQECPPAARGDGWGWFLAELFGDFIPDSVWLLAMAALVLFIAAAFFVVIFDSFDRTPLQKLGLK